MSILLTPRATEKAYAQAANNVYVFDVPLSANKAQIMSAVAEQFDVTVKDARTVIQSGKSVRYSRGKNRYPGTTVRKDVKKAYVTLAEGSSIKLYDEATESKEEKS